MTNFIGLRSLSAALLLAASAAPALAEDTIRLAVLPYMGQAVLAIGIAEGHFEAEGITIERVDMRDPSPITPGLMSGDIDVALTIPSAGFYNAIARGGGARIVGPGVTFSPDACDATMIYGRKGLDLAAIASTPGSDLKVAASPNTFMEYAVRLLNQMPDFGDHEMAFETVWPTSLGDAMSNGAVDIALTAEPWISRLDSGGVGQGVVGLSAYLPDAQFTFLVFSERLLTGDPDLGRRARRALDAAIAQYHEGKTPRNIEILAEFTGLDEAFIANTCWAHVPGGTDVSEAHIMDFQAWLLERDLIDEVLPAARLLAKVPAQ